MKVHFVESVQENGEGLIAWVERFANRKPRCGCCGLPAPVRRHGKKQRTWRGLSMGMTPLWLVYAPCQVDCPTCGVKTEHLPWSDRWERITTALAQSVFLLTRELSLKAAAEYFGLSWKTVARVVRESVARSLKKRKLRRVRTIGIDEVSRKKGHHYLTVVYD